MEVVNSIHNASEKAEPSIENEFGSPVGITVGVHCCVVFQIDALLQDVFVETEQRKD